jgi:uncharacterized protein
MMSASLARRRTSSLGALAALLLPFAGAFAQQPIPPLQGRVVDTTRTLSTAARDALEQKLAAFEQRKGAQIAVLLVPTTSPEAIEQYSLRVAEAWEIGRGKVDDGIVVVIAKDDRRLRVEVGYGLEGAVPDALARRIIAERIVPRFYEDDYAGGIEAGVDALIGLIDGEPLPAADGGGRNDGVDGFGALPLVLIMAAFVAPLLRRTFGRLGGALLLGGGAGFVTWLLSSLLFVSLVVGAMAFVFGLAGLTRGPARWSSGGPWGGGFGGAGWGGGRGGGGGGFRGGGGRFGGGGASGRW